MQQKQTRFQVTSLPWPKQPLIRYSLSLVLNKINSTPILGRTYQIESINLSWNDTQVNKNHQVQITNGENLILHHDGELNFLVTLKNKIDEKGYVVTEEELREVVQPLVIKINNHYQKEALV